MASSFRCHFLDRMDPLASFVLVKKPLAGERDAIAVLRLDAKRIRTIRDDGVDGLGHAVEP